MDLGLHLTSNDVNSKLDPEVFAIAQQITPGPFGKVWDLFNERQDPITTDLFRVLYRNYTAPTVVQGTTAGTTLWDNVATVLALPVTAGTIDRLTIGDMLLIDSEIVVVKAVNRGANTIDVYERGACETTAAVHGTTAKTINIIGNANVEGAVSVEPMAEQTTRIDNYCQLVEEQIQYSIDDQNQGRFTGATPETLKSEAVYRASRDMAKTAIFSGMRAPTSTSPGTTRGLQKWLKYSGGITTAVGGAFTEATLITLLQTIRQAGGMPNAIVMSVAKKQLFNAFTSVVNTYVNTELTDGVAGRVVSKYASDGFGIMPIIVDVDMPLDEVYVVNTNKLNKGWKVGDELRFSPEPSNSRSHIETLQGKFGLAVEGIGYDHGALTGLT